MSRSDPHLILTLPNAGSSAVTEATRLLQEQGFEVVQKPGFGVDGGSALLRRKDVEVALSWFRDGGMAVACRNRSFEKERDDVVELLRPLKHVR